jgi:hypothetical protein
MTEPSTPRPSNNPTGRKTVAAAEKRRQAVELRKAGATFEEIAQAVGYGSKGAAYRAVETELRNAVREPVRELIELETARLDLMLRALWPSVARGQLGAIDRALRVAERRARLLGLDAAQAVTVSGPDGGPVEVDVTGMTPEEKRAQLEQLVQEASRRLRKDGPADPVDGAAPGTGS